MIKIDSSKKCNILYQNYIKQFSKSYLCGSILYVGDSLNNASYTKKLYIENFIKKYSSNFIKLYMSNNKVHNELYSESLCIICLENLNENIVDICHKCNIKCHKRCINNWYRKNEKKVCPICLKSEEYYLNILQNSGNINSNINEDINEDSNEIDNNNTILDNIIDNIFDNNILCIQRNFVCIDLLKKICSFCLLSTIICMLFFIVVYF